MLEGGGKAPGKKSGRKKKAGRRVINEDGEEVIEYDDDQEGRKINTRDALNSYLKLQ
jgi:hypothetical protein